MHGFLAINFQALRDGKVIGGLVEMRHVVKGEEGHTSQRLYKEVVACMRELAVLHEIALVPESDLEEVDKAEIIDLLKSDAGKDYPDVVAKADAALRRCVAIVTDGGANMARAAADLIAAHGGGNDRARLCVSHTLQLVLKYFCIEDSALANVLAGSMR